VAVADEALGQAAEAAVRVVVVVRVVVAVRLVGRVLVSFVVRAG